MTALNKSQWVLSTQGSRRYLGFQKYGNTGNHVDPTKYTAVHSFGHAQYLSNGRTSSGNFDAMNANYYGKTASSFPAARNRAYAKLVASVRSESAQLGTAFAEWRESLGMIADRGLSLYHAYRHLRRGHFRQFLGALSIGPKRKHRNKIRNSVGEASSLWLEYSFGWKPLFQDIHDGMNAMGQPVPGGSHSGSGTQDYFWEGNQTNPSERDYLSGRASVKQGADVYISNPNLYLLQQLGIANPAQIAWELVPFSFVVDWVFDVSSFLGSFTDFLGCDVIRPYTTLFIRGGMDYYVSYHGVPYPRFTGKFAYITRVGGLSRPMPNISFLANIGTSMNRAANAVSLLGQILAK